MNTRPLLALLLTLVAAGATAQVYRWVDKDGKVHYSQQKPPDQKAEQLNIQSSPSLTRPAAGNPEAGANPAATPATGQAPAEGEQPASENDPVRAQLEKLRKERCETARAVQTRYKGAPYLERTVDGQKVRLSVEEEAAERVRVDQAVTEACAPPAN